MTPDRAASVFRELLQTPPNALDQVGRRTGLTGNPTVDDLAHAQEILRALVVALQSGPGPNWEPIHTAWGALVARHGQVQVAAMGPSRPDWIRDVPAKPGLGDPAPGTPEYAEAQQRRERFVPKAQQQQPQQYDPSRYDPSQFGPPAGAHAVPRTEPGGGPPEPPPPPGRDAWPAPPANLHQSYPPAAGYPPAPQQGYPPAPQQGYPPAPQHGYPPAPLQHGYPPAPQAHPPAYPQGYAQAPGYPPQPFGPPPQPPQPEPQRFVPQRAPARPVSAPPPPAREPAPDQGRIDQSVARYAAFCAACAGNPDRVFATMVEYGIQSPEARNQLDAMWQDRFDEDAALHAQWEQLFAKFRGQLRG